MLDAHTVLQLRLAGFIDCTPGMHTTPTAQTTTHAHRLPAPQLSLAVMVLLCRRQVVHQKSIGQDATDDADLI